MRSRIVFRRTAQETERSLLEFDFFLAGRGVIAEEHLHPVQHERFEVIAGQVKGLVAGRARTAGPGDEVTVPPGVRHAWWNAGDETAHLRVQFRPALATETLFETFFALARSGRTDERGVPNLFWVAVLLTAHPNEMYPAFIPVPLLKALFTLTAPIGRALGYRADYGCAT
jgi:quercetin dioxygenase-like cupin family protein